MMHWITFCWWAISAIVWNAYKETEKYGNKPWCKEKDWVLIGRYAGSRFRLGDDHEVRIINDDDIIGTILDPDDIKSL